jgi:hypothetical protein
MAQFIPCTKIVTEEKTAKLFLDNIYHIHGLPNNIVRKQGGRGEEAGGGRERRRGGRKKGEEGFLG